MSDAVDTSKIFKKAVHCFVCEKEFYSTLSAIAQSEHLACPCCGARIDLTARQYRSLVANVKEGDPSNHHTSIAWDALSPRYGGALVGQRLLASRADNQIGRLRSPGAKPLHH